MKKEAHSEDMYQIYLNSGDIVILTHPHSLSENASNNIINSMKGIYDHLDVKNIKTLILEEGMDIKILKKERA